MAFETINSTYSNIRGACYFPTYKCINDNPVSGWADVSGADIMWKYFDSTSYGGITPEDNVDSQLGHLKAIGFNCVRVWLPFNPSAAGHDEYSYVGDKTGFITKFKKFLDKAITNEIYVIPVLFDSSQLSPSDTELATTVASQAAYDSSDAHDFVADIKTTKLNSTYTEVLLLIDIFNEPWSGATSSTVQDNRQKLISFAAAQLKSGGSGIKTLVGAAGWTSDSFSTLTMSDNNVDVLSIHPYSVTNRITAASLADVRGYTSKPVIVTETGSNGNGSIYKDSIEAAQDSNLGWMIFQAMIGWNDEDSEFIFGQATGLVYADGQIHNYSDALPIWKAADNASASGLVADTAALKALEISSSHALYWERYPVNSAQWGGLGYLKMYCRHPYLVNLLDSTAWTSLVGTMETFCTYDAGVGSALTNDPWPQLDVADLFAARAEYYVSPSYNTLKNWLKVIERYVLMSKYQCVNKTFYGGRVWNLGEVITAESLPSSDFELIDDVYTAADFSPYKDYDDTFYFGCDGWERISAMLCEQEFSATNVSYNDDENTVTFSTSATTSNYLSVAFVLPSSWKNESTVIPEIMWKQDSAESVAWKVKTRVYSPGDPVPSWSSSWLSLDTDRVTYSSGTMLQISYAPSGISMSGLTDGAVVELRLCRDADDLEDNADAICLALRYQIDSLGAGQAGEK